ncbi:hypothetical protein SERLA73DRAFT_75760 [Serpula lacrymans var. lacrymans S7.3]|uniref:Uncharacterized protein n=2 Tax=Serpula lacrymans var. lacrymans TaxID=341189 RepID=F8Q458_SERL3|nr:uncharacterized protein SERLADRAFT_440529 [Serpula lacrymans var. lacrymans S7.9]EGN96914.1 hypothetical protein SERLA73DRAFT_75760 [Serpula lacrymans var. lacrymans S7.3]EGO22508.1 hypothetical protein SERLADRAFT_440529 [Serpula lacrymans var. lacrymans S7.9]
MSKADKWFTKTFVWAAQQTAQEVTEVQCCKASSSFPQLTNPAEKHKAWIEHHERPYKGVTLYGIHNTCDLEEVEGYLLLARLCPTANNKQGEANYLHFTKTAIKLLASGTDSISALRMELNIVPKRMYERYQGPLETLTEENVVRHFAANGVTTEEAIQARQFARTWI